jgi:hypothetical protein
MRHIYYIRGCIIIIIYLFHCWEQHRYYNVIFGLSHGRSCPSALFVRGTAARPLLHMADHLPLLGDWGQPRTPDPDTSLFRARRIVGVICSNKAFHLTLVLLVIFYLLKLCDDHSS